MEIQSIAGTFDTTVVVAIVTASGVIIAAAITATISFLSLSNQKKAESKLRQRQARETIYSDLLVSLQEVMNTADINTKFHDFQIQCVKCFAHGDDEVAFHTSQYFETIVKYTQSNKIITQETHEGFQSAIINSIRETQGLGNLPGIRMIPFNPHMR